MATNPPETSRYRLEDLRRLASALATGAGVAPARGAELASHLLWFDAVGALSHGIARLPDWLDRLDRKEIDPVAVGRATVERAGTAVFDAQNGLPPLALDRAAGIAAEKARDVGIGLVRVENLGVTGPSAPVAANLAIGPQVAIIAGPGGSLTLGIPSADGLPVVYDSRLGSVLKPTELSQVWAPWINAISGVEGWVILAISVTAFEPLPSFHERVSKLEPGGLSPQEWETRRREARERGIVVDEQALMTLKFRAERLGVAWPTVIEV